MISISQIITLKEINTPEARIKLRSDGIVHVHYKKNVVIDSETQVSMRAHFQELAPGKRLKYIFSADAGVTFTKEARENSVNSQHDSPIAAYAILANNVAYRIIANFYLKVNKPRVPYKMFAEMEEAEKWLHSR
jgi:hypothetical protein